MNKILKKDNNNNNVNVNENKTKLFKQGEESDCDGLVLMKESDEFHKEQLTQFLDQDLYNSESHHVNKQQQQQLNNEKRQQQQQHVN